MKAAWHRPPRTHWRKHAENRAGQGGAPPRSGIKADGETGHLAAMQSRGGPGRAARKSLHEQPFSLRARNFAAAAA